MKSGWYFLGPWALLISACESPSPANPYASRRDLGGTSLALASTSRPVVVTPAAATASQPPPDAEVLYQERASDAFGSSTYTSRTQVHGPVVEEVHIGNQRVDPYQPLYPPTTVNGVVQPGYVPSGTQYVIDPATGRRIPVRRR